MNKSEFIRAQDPGMSAGKVVELAAKQGMKLTDNFVHTVRYNARCKADIERQRGTSRVKKTNNADPVAALVAKFAAEITGILRAQAIEKMKEALR